MTPDANYCLLLVIIAYHMLGAFERFVNISFIIMERLKDLSIGHVISLERLKDLSMDHA